MEQPNQHRTHAAPAHSRRACAVALLFSLLFAAAVHVVCAAGIAVSPASLAMRAGENATITVFNPTAQVQQFSVRSKNGTFEIQPKTGTVLPQGRAEVFIHAPAGGGQDAIEVQLAGENETAGISAAARAGIPAQRFVGNEMTGSIAGAIVQAAKPLAISAAAAAGVLLFTFIARKKRNKTA